MQSLRKRVNDTAKRFRILKKWKIKAGTKKDNVWDRVYICGKRREAIVYPWWEGAPTKEPDDYVLHEVLHCALREFSMMDRRKVKEMRSAEEELIRDICSFCVSQNTSKSPAACFNNEGDGENKCEK